MTGKIVNEELTEQVRQKVESGEMEGPAWTVYDTGLGDNTHGIMECSECKCRAFTITSMKDNESHVRKGKRMTTYRCVGCGADHNSIAQNLNDLGSFGWREMKGEISIDSGDMEGENSLSDHEYLQWGRLNRIMKSFRHAKKQSEIYARTLESYMGLHNDLNN